MYYAVATHVKKVLNYPVMIYALQCEEFVIGVYPVPE